MSTVVAVVGLGEAGGLYARGLSAAGYTVHGFDPYTTLGDPAVTQHPELASAVADADLVMSLVGANAARAVTLQVVDAISSGSPLIADLNTGSPELKRSLGELARRRGLRFVDVAVLAPVPRAGSKTPLMVSGAASQDFAQLFAASGAVVDAIGGEPGDAAARKLIRSVFMKGLAGVLLESTLAAEAAGCAEWLRDQIAGELTGDAYALIDRLVTGSRQHAARRVHEMDDAHDYLKSVGTPTWATDASRAWLSSLAEPASAP